MFSITRTDHAGTSAGAWSRGHRVLRASPVLHPEIIARQSPALVIAPPFHGDALRPFCACHLVQHPPPAEAHGRTVRHLGNGLDGLWPCEQTDWADSCKAILNWSRQGLARHRGGGHRGSDMSRNLDGSEFRNMSVVGDDAPHAFKTKARAETIDQPRQLLAMIGMAETGLTRIERLCRNHTQPQQIETKAWIALVTNRRQPL